MKNEFAFLFPYPKSVMVRDGFIDIRDLCFPLEIHKKYVFLFDYFGVRNRNRGLEIIFQERRGLGDEEYVLESGRLRVLASASSARGQFYALSTLLQILSFHGGSGRMPIFTIRDAPEIAMRGFIFSAAGGAVPGAAEQQRLLLKLALLRFNCFAMPAAGSAKTEHIAARARRMGMEVLQLPADTPAAADPAGSGPAPSDSPGKGPEANGKEDLSASWFGDFLHRCRLGKAGGERMLVWGGRFAGHGEWIRKLPGNVLVFQKGPHIERAAFLKDRVLPFKKHHIPQVLCPAIRSRDRFIPAMRLSLAGIRAAFQTVRAEKLAGIMLIGGESGGNGCLPEASALLHFEAGCLFWSGRPPVPAAFSLWALGRDEPDLFRVYSFLAQLDHQLGHSHGQYLFEDPVFAAFSRPGDPREIEAHYRKAALYLKKRKIARNELSDFLGFTRQLCEFIAAKVEFSSRLLRFLEEKDGPDEIRRQAAGLAQGAEKLKCLYLELWRRRFQPEGLPDFVGNFAFLQERFQHIRQAVARPAARENLLAEMKSYSSLASPAAADDWEP